MHHSYHVHKKTDYNKLIQYHVLCTLFSVICQMYSCGNGIIQVIGFTTLLRIPQ